jgi:hypothetical protein
MSALGAYSARIGSALQQPDHLTPVGTVLSFPAPMRPRRNVAFGVSVLLVMLGGASCFGDDNATPARAKGKGRVTIVYQDATTL